jgi:hypothetical protein
MAHSVTFRRVNSHPNPQPELTDSTNPAPNSELARFGIPAWLPKAAHLLLPNPSIWKSRRIKKTKPSGFNWQFIAPALLMMLLVQSIFVWQLFSPVEALIVEEEIEIEIPIDLSTLISESDLEPEPEPKPEPANGTQASAAPAPAKAAVAKALPVQARPIARPAPEIAKAIVTAPSLAVNIPASAPIAQASEEQSVPNSESESAPEKIAPMMERAEQVVDTQISLTPMTPPLTTDIVEPIREAAPIALAPERPFELAPPIIDQPEPLAPDPVRVATLPERVRPENVKPITPESAPNLIKPSMSTEIATVRPALIPAEAILIERTERAKIAPIEPTSITPIDSPSALALPSIAQAESDAPSTAAQTSSSEATDALDQQTAQSSDSQAITRFESDGSGLDLLGDLAEAAADQAAQNAPSDGRNAFRRYDDPFADDKPDRLRGLKLREPQLFLDLAKYLVGQLNTVGAQYALVQLGSNEEIEDFTDVDLGPLIKAWVELHHGDLSKQCRQNNPDLSAAMRDVLCGG